MWSQCLQMYPKPLKSLIFSCHGSNFEPKGTQKASHPKAPERHPKGIPNGPKRLPRVLMLAKGTKLGSQSDPKGPQGTPRACQGHSQSIPKKLKPSIPLETNIKIMKMWKPIPSQAESMISQWSWTSKRRKSATSPHSSAPLPFGSESLATPPITLPSAFRNP